MPQLLSAPLSTCEIPVAAEALEKKPANVMATCIVERNAVESSKSVCTRLAFVLPFGGKRLDFRLVDGDDRHFGAGKKRIYECQRHQ